MASKIRTEPIRFGGSFELHVRAGEEGRRALHQARQERRCSAAGARLPGRAGPVSSVCRLRRARIPTRLSPAREVHRRVEAGGGGPLPVARQAHGGGRFQSTPSARRATQAPFRRFACYATRNPAARLLPRHAPIAASTATTPTTTTTTTTSTEAASGARGTS